MKHIRSYEWIEYSENKKYRQVYINEQLNVSGLLTFGWHKARQAIPALPLHYHKDCFEFTYLIDGNVLFKVDDDVFNLTHGDLLIVPPNTLHNTANSPLSIHQMYWFQIKPNPNNMFDLKQSASKKMTEDLQKLSTKVIKIYDKNFKHLLIKAFSLLPNSKNNDLHLLAPIFTFLINTVLYEQQAFSGQLIDNLAPALSYIDDHIYDDITLIELANECCLSTSHFKQKFSKEIGLPPREYINYKKIQQAKKLLHNNNHINEIAMNLGFSSSNYFSVVFKKFTNTTPTEFIKSNKK